MEQQERQLTVTDIVQAEAKEERDRHARAVRAGRALVQEHSGESMSTWDVLRYIANEAQVTEQDAQLAAFELVDRGDIVINEKFSLTLDARQGETDDRR